MADKKRTAKVGQDFINDAIVDTLLKESLDGLSNKTVDSGEFYKQLIEFQEDKSYVERFKGCLLNTKYGIEIFKFNPKRDIENAIFTIGGGGFMKTDQIREATHIAKIIKEPNSRIKDTNGEEVGVSYKEGDLVLLSPSQTVGETWNPEYIMVLQMAQSNMEPKLPNGLREKVDKSVAAFSNDLFLPPHEYKTPLQDVCTFAVDNYNIVGKFEI